MPRTCFVIMPFSKTSTCSEGEWTHIFENVLKPSIENAGIDYICKRSEATRGNIVGAILRDLNDSYIVLADLTDRNANVFYELGVRHALKDRTLLIAQKRDDIPFDLQAYAYHVYDWRTPESIGALSSKIKDLLIEIDNNPERPDNPVSDFLGMKQHPNGLQAVQEVISPTETAVAQPLVGVGAEGINMSKLVQGLVKRGRPNDFKTIMRLTKVELIPLLIQLVKSLNERETSGQVSRDKIFEQAKVYIAELEPLVNKIEEFGLACVQEGLKSGVDVILKLSGNLVSISERPRDGRAIRYAQGAPSLMAWRMICTCAAKALDDDEFDLVRYFLREPIEVEEVSGQFSNLSLIDRRNLFHPEAFLGYADFPMQYMDGLWKDNEYFRLYFESNETYQLAIARLFILVVLAASSVETKDPLYPGYRLLNQASRAMSSFTSRMFSSPDYLKKIAGILEISDLDLKKDWTQKVKAINSVASGESHFLNYNVSFPENFG